MKRPTEGHPVGPNFSLLPVVRSQLPREKSLGYSRPTALRTKRSHFLCNLTSVVGSRAKHDWFSFASSLTLNHMTEHWQRGDYEITTERSRLNIDLIHRYLSRDSYWASGRSREVIARSIQHSLPFGLFKGSEQVGFARIVTDYATFAWVADVFVLPEHRGLGLAKWLMEVIIAHPELQGFRRWVLSTKDAHGLYERFGFMKLYRPERWMERPDPKMQESPDYWLQNPKR